MDGKRREKSGYPGVYYRMAQFAGGGEERRYYIAYRLPGEARVIEESVGGSRGKEKMTAARAAQIRAAVITGKRAPRRDRRRGARSGAETLDCLMESYLQNVDHGARADDYCRRFRQRYDIYVRPRLGEKKISDIVPLDLERLKRTPPLADRAPATKNQVLLIFKVLSRHAVRLQMPGMSFKVDLLKLNNRRVDFLTPAQVARLREVLRTWPDRQVAAVVMLALLAGLRRSEILGLRWQDVDLERKRAFIPHPKNGRAFWAPLSDQAVEVFRAIAPTDHDGDGLVFTASEARGKMRTRLARDGRAIQEAAGLPARWRLLHSCRHHFASSLVQHGVPLYTVAGLLNHRSSRSTERYAHLAPGTLQAGADLAGEIFEGSKDDEESVAKIGG